MIGVGRALLAGNHLGMKLWQSVRVANYIKTLRRDLVKVAEACGVEHPGLIDTDSVEVLDGRTGSTALRDVYGYQPGWGLPSAPAVIYRYVTSREVAYVSIPVKSTKMQGSSPTIHAS